MSWQKNYFHFWIVTGRRMASKDVFGYVQSLSPTKKSKSSQAYFNFKVQTSESDCRRIVCFDEKLRSSIESYGQSRTPVKLKNVSERRGRIGDEVNVIVNKRTKIEEASNTEVPFDFRAMEDEDQVRRVKVAEIEKVKAGQLVTIDGRISMDINAVQVLRINQRPVRCLEKAMLNDETGSICITLWDDLIDILENEGCYQFNELRVKVYQGVKRLTTTPTTVSSHSEEEFPLLGISELDRLLELEEEEVESFEVAEDFRKWLTCKRCHKAITEIGTLNVVSCSCCGAVQRCSTCDIKFSVRVTLPNGERLTAFEDQLGELLTRYNDLNEKQITLESSDDEIYLAVLSVRNMVVIFRKSNKIIQRISFV